MRFATASPGNDYRGACNATFARNHAAALRVTTLRRAIERNRGDVGWREAEIRSDKTSDSRRAQLRSDVRELDRNREVLRDDLVRAERELDRLMAAQPAVQPATPWRAAPAAPPPPPKPAAVDVGPAGTATGTLVAGGVTVPLRFAYTFVAPDPLDNLTKRPVVLLTQEPIPPAAIAQAPGSRPDPRVAAVVRARGAQRGEAAQGRDGRVASAARSHARDREGRGQVRRVEVRCVRRATHRRQPRIAGQRQDGVRVEQGDPARGEVRRAAVAQLVVPHPSSPDRAGEGSRYPGIVTVITTPLPSARFSARAVPRWNCAMTRTM